MARLSVFILAIFFVSQGSASSVYKDLHKEILSQTHMNVIPKQDSGPVVVMVDVGLIDISDVDREKNLVELSVFISFSWNSTIMWNPADFNGLTDSLLPSNLLWSPGLHFMNVAGGIERFGQEDTAIMFNGLTGAFSCYHLKIFCDLSKGDHCSLQISSDQMNNVVSFLDPKNNPLDFAEYFDYWRHKNAQYPLSEATEVKRSISYEGVPGETDRVDYEFSFKDPHRYYRHRH